MKHVDTLIIAGASITSSPWLTWADAVIEMLQPKNVINLSARGTGNYYIALSCINAISTSKLGHNTLCIPMFTCIDKFDMYLDSALTAEYTGEKHPPLDINGQAAKPGADFSFWSTGSHWPLIKEQYRNNFFNTDISCVNNMLMFRALESVCSENNVDLMPLFDMDIWEYTENDINEYFVNSKPLTKTPLLEQPLSKNIKSILDARWFDFTSLIGYAMDNQLPVYDAINKLHPPSNVHLRWAKECVVPALEKQYAVLPISQRFINMTENLSSIWNTATD